MKTKPILITATCILLVSGFLLAQSKSAAADAKPATGRFRSAVVFSPLTLAAFKNAAKLKARYSSVLWFNHVHNKTYFYVVKGRQSKVLLPSHEIDGNLDYKIGLVNPELKEIIPAEYDLIHNIGGTIDGLVEVEKGDKKGLFNFDGKNVVPANYDQIFALKNDENLALLRKDDDYFYLKSDFTITDKLPDFKIETVLPKIKNIGDSYTLSGNGSKNIMEYNSREYCSSLIIPPSYLVELQILPKFLDFRNLLRSNGADCSDNLSYAVKAERANRKSESWLGSVFHDIVASFIDGRSGLYETKNLVMVDKKQNRLLGYTASNNYFGGAEGTGVVSDNCNENALRTINDTLFEFKTTADLDIHLFNDDHLEEAPYYHYLTIRNGSLAAFADVRMFNCTKYVKMDDSYLKGTFIINNKPINHATPEILRYMKNEIYASHNYQFKTLRWIEVFAQPSYFSYKKNSGNADVEEFLSPIEKYNVAWINSKLNKAKPNTLTAK